MVEVANPRAWALLLLQAAAVAAAEQRFVLFNQYYGDDRNCTSTAHPQFMMALDVCYGLGGGRNFGVYKLHIKNGSMATRNVTFFTCNDSSCSQGCVDAESIPLNVCQAGQVPMMSVLTDTVPRKSAGMDHLAWSFAKPKCRQDDLYKVEFLEHTCYSEGPVWTADYCTEKGRFMKATYDNVRDCNANVNRQHPMPVASACKDAGAPDNPQSQLFNCSA